MVPFFVLMVACFLEIFSDESIPGKWYFEVGSVWMLSGGSSVGAGVDVAVVLVLLAVVSMVFGDEVLRNFAIANMAMVIRIIPRIERRVLCV